MVQIRKAAIAAAVLIGAFCSTGASATPVSSARVLGPTGVELVQWHGSSRRHVGPRHRRCWWENRRVRDHRGRWVVRRVQVCLR